MIRRLAIFGATGDLTRRYLLPAIGSLIDRGQLPAGLPITGVGRSDWDEAAYRDWVFSGPGGAELSEVARDAFGSTLQYRAADVTKPAELRDALAPLAEPLVVYLALPPALLAAVIRALATIGLPEGSRVVIEKPFGEDLASARELNELLHDVLPEDSVYRIDHFLHKQTVQNILGLRFANRIFEPLWSRDHIERVDIIWDETLGLEGRADYYDRAGALLDMVQNHLLQLLSLIAMEPPRTMSAGDLRDRKVEVLRATRCLDEDEVIARTVRARYTAGIADGRQVPNYVDEPGVEAGRSTETYADVELAIDNGRWADVPFRLRTGKALARDRREILITFRDIPDPAFAEPDVPTRNLLRLTLDPDAISLRLNVNGAGDPFELESVELDARLSTQEVPAYGRLLLGILDGDPTFSIRDDEAEEAWRVIEPITRAWARDRVPLDEYRAGSDGPVSHLASGAEPERA